MDDRKIYLHAEIDDEGNLRVHDQDGREVTGLTNVQINLGVNDVTRLILTVIDMVDGRAWTPKPKKEA